MSFDPPEVFDDTLADCLRTLDGYDLPPERAQAVRVAARDALRASAAQARSPRATWRAVESVATFAFGAAQLMLAIARFLDRP